MVELTLRSCYVAIRDNVPFPCAKGILNSFSKENFHQHNYFQGQLKCESRMVAV